MLFRSNGERKSGVLPPFIGSTSQGGSEISIPYYFNIAPNMDLTLYGRHMEKRGEQVNGDFRYLQPTYGGQMKFELLPDDKVLLPGVVDTSTNFLEHPELVAQRLCRLAEIVGRERVIASSDCGFGTFAGYGKLDPEVSYRKLGALVEGAALASKRLWARAN